MSVSFGGFNENTATFKVAENIAKNSAVKVSDSNTVAACEGGEAFCGIVLECSGGYASVQLSGTVTSKYSGSAPAFGYTKLAGDGDKVTASENGREYLVFAVDETAQTVTFLM